MIEGIDHSTTIFQYYFAPYLQIETKFMMRNKIIFYCFIRFSKSGSKMPTANPFTSTVKAGCKLMTPPYILITMGKNSVANATVLVVLIYHKHVNTLNGPNH